METSTNSNNLNKNAEIMTLKGYYSSLPDATYPKSDFIREVAKQCNVTENTVRNWIQYGMKPNNPEHIKILSDVTGISQNELWN